MEYTGDTFTGVGNLPRYVETPSLLQKQRAEASTPRFLLLITSMVSRRKKQKNSA